VPIELRNWLQSSLASSRQPSTAAKLRRILAYVDQRSAGARLSPVDVINSIHDYNVMIHWQRQVRRAVNKSTLTAW
jgi:hypothetical protein